MDATERKAVIEWLHDIVSKEIVSTNEDGIEIAKGAMPWHAMPK